MSFRLKTIIGIALIEGVLLLILVINSLSILRNASDEAMSNYANTATKLFATSIKDAILSLDLATIDSLVHAALKNPGISYVRVEANGLTLSQDGDKVALARPFIIDQSMKDVQDGIFDTRAHIEEGGVIYGTVKLGISVERMTNFLAQAKSEATLLALTSMGMVAIFSLLLGTYLTRQLLRLENASRSIADGEVGLQISVNGNDELARTARAFNLMSRKLKELYQTIENDHARLYTIIETVHDGIITINQSGIIESVNHSANLIFGYQGDELIGRSISMLMPQASRHQHEGYIKNHTTSNDARIMDKLRSVQAMRRNGETFPLEVMISEMEFDDEVKFVAVLRDVSAAKEASEKLRKSEILKSSIYNAALDAIITIDANGIIMEFNQRAEEMFGYRRNEVIGATLEDTIIPPRYREAHTNGIKRYLANGTPKLLGKRVEIEAVNKDGEELPIELWITPIILNNNTIFTSFIRDISERKHYEKLILTAKEEAEAASKAKSDFLAVMSHEIRTPLNAILGSLTILEDSALDTEQQRHLNNARQGGESMLMVINDILDYSKIEADKLSLEETEFDLLQLLEGVCTMLAIKATEKAIELSLLIDPQLPRTLLGDPNRLQQILLNLISNAIKFTDHGGIILSARQGDGERLYIEVEDSGIGISEKNQKSLFQKFEQVDSSYSRKYGGTGLGLAISRRLIEMMHGKIGVQSEPGVGSRFWFEVPLPTASGSWGETEHLAAPPDDIARVILSESNPMTRKALRQQFAFWGIAVDPSADTINESQLIIEQRGSRRNYELITDGDTPREGVAQVHKPLFYSSLLALLSGTYPQPKNSSAPPHSVTPTVTGKRLLLVEDVSANQLVAKTMLEHAGYTVDVANNGQEAIESAIRQNYDLILMDLSMPKMDGITATRHIFEQIPAQRRPPIVAMTANVTTDDREKCMGAGMCDFISKPIVRQTMLDVLARHLGDKEKPNAAAHEDSTTHAVTAKPEKPDGSSCLDMTTLAKLDSELGEEILSHAISIYIKESQPRLKKIDAACHDDDLEVIRVEAHALKGSSGTLGVAGLHQMAKELEARCREGNKKEVHTLASTITAYGMDCLTELASHYGLPPPG